MSISSSGQGSATDSATSSFQKLVSGAVVVEVAGVSGPGPSPVPFPCHVRTASIEDLEHLPGQLHEFVHCNASIEVAVDDSPDRRL